MSDVDLQRPKRRREATVERLLDAALQTFAEQGFAAASVEDICSRGGLTRGAFYSSFTSKDELFEALMTREVERDLARVAELLTGLADEPDPLAAAVDRVLGAFRCDRTWALVVTEYTLHAARNPEAAEVLRRHDEQVGSRLADLVDRMAAEAGLVFTLPAADLIGAATALLSGLTVMSLTAQGDLEPLRRTALLSLVRGAVSSTPTTP
ncbi:TetR/AcrR family transcriptional regulator [Modestobacter sp. VKM Ac-2984]|uniref:TetR/AcrR family transcriptional regulator n=1 Tax=Modestobacter sp. VKM Ac-2984 TaxID=3004138 RepID=UPI0022AA33EC|nr:TetR/AcrR family transcriptional regulator [Modestobacter sp. VKM Ac-2984]MCZ2815498.1 TetR/AcrR family transcriptional regulator [Modestobacter sp. VKM Ac-2984]